MFKNLLARFFKKFIQSEANLLFSDKLKEADKERETFKLSMLQDTINTPVIVFGNEWENPVIGFVVGIDFITKAKQPIQVIKDYLTGEEVLAHATVWPFTFQRFSALMKLDPMERWVVVNPYINREYAKDVLKLEVLTKAEIITLLNKNDFFVRFNEYLAKSEDQDEEVVLTEVE